MRFILPLILLYVFLSAGTTLSQDRSFYVSPLLSYEKFRTQDFDYGIDYGAAAGVRLSDALSLSASAAFGRRTLSFDVIGGTGSIGAGLVTVSGSIELLLLGRAGSAQASATLGAGRIFSTFDAYRVSLGALGSVTIPAHSSAQNYIQAGVTGEIPLTAGVSVVILPSVRFFAPLSSQADFSIAGGFRVGIL
jgi:hypothetical protein